MHRPVWTGHGFQGYVNPRRCVGSHIAIIPLRLVDGDLRIFPARLLDESVCAPKMSTHTVLGRNPDPLDDDRNCHPVIDLTEPSRPNWAAIDQRCAIAATGDNRVSTRTNASTVVPSTTKVCVPDPERTGNELYHVYLDILLQFLP